jgi:flagellar biosynthesis protein FlhF
VVFGLTHPPQAAAVPPPLPFQPADPVAALAEQVAELRRQMERVLTPASAPVTAPPADGVATAATLGNPGTSQARVMLVGPPGVGKTSTAVKIAARYGVHINKDTQLLSTDIYRVAAADQLQTLAAILGTACEIVEPPALLPQTLDRLAAKSLVVIDTPGFGLGEMNQSFELVRASATCRDLDVHLVLSASMKPADAVRIAQAYSMFRPGKLIFTRIDETIDRGSMFEVAAQLNLPVSFLSTGQRIPEDIEPATRRRLADLLEAPPRSPAQRKGANA